MVDSHVSALSVDYIYDHHIAEPAAEAVRPRCGERPEKNQKSIR
jgi:hypothetical protein